jgi:hypothetical protein
MRWYALSLASLAACANLPELDRGACGNAIVELGEDCDSFESDPLSRCLSPGEDGACHFSCASGPAGVRWTCPAAWACDADALCRRPTGSFEPALKYTVGGASSLAAGDFDGDGRSDLVSRNPSDLTGRSTLSFHYFDARAELVDTRPYRKLVMAPAIGKLSSDKLDDLVFSDFRVGVLLGRADRSWVPEAFTPYVLPAGRVRLTGMREGSVGVASPLATLATLGQGPGVYVPDVVTRTIALRAPIRSPLEALLGDPLTVDIVEGPNSPCYELVLAFGGESTFQLLEFCAPERADGGVSWLPTATARTIALVPPAALDAAPLAGDLNGDGHLDVLVGAGGITYAAYGDGRGLSAASPYVPVSGELAEPIPAFSMPLAVGDVSMDGAPDFVLPDRIILSQLATGAERPQYNVVHANSDGLWTTARIADLNGNGFPDVVAAERGRLHVDFLNGSGKPWVLESKVLSARPVSQLGVGDFDGDLIEDLVLVEEAASAEELDTVKVAFGALSQAPGIPQTVARARSVQQVGGYREAGTDSLIVVAAHPDAQDARILSYLFGGNAERIPFAALELNNFTQDGSIDNVVSTMLVLGAFAGPAPKDALVLSIDLGRGDWHFWLVPALDDPLPSPLPLSGALDPRLAPSAASGMNIQFPAAKIYATGAAADLDRDGRDEAIWVMPAEQGTRCGIETFRTSGQAPQITLVSGGLILLDATCTDPQVSTVDADQDGALDLVLLTGSLHATDRKLLVLWNDGSGHFAADRSFAINASTDSPQAFTMLPATATAPLSVVYATQRAVVQWRYAGARAFAAPVKLADLRDGTGIVAADLDGDGATDLAVADDGDITVLKAQVR